MNVNGIGPENSTTICSTGSANHVEDVTVGFCDADDSMKHVVTQRIALLSWNVFLERSIAVYFCWQHVGSNAGHHVKRYCFEDKHEI